MNVFTLFGAYAVALMLLSYALEHRSAWWVFVFAALCGLLPLWLACRDLAVWSRRKGWALVALRRWLRHTRHHVSDEATRAS